MANPKSARWAKISRAVIKQMVTLPNGGKSAVGRYMRVKKGSEIVVVVDLGAAIGFDS